MRFVNRDNLAAYLKIDRSTLNRWSQQGLIEGEIRAGYQTRFSETAVNAFLAINTHEYTEPPTLADLQAKRVVFIAADEAARLYQIPRDRWLTLVRQGTIRSFSIESLRQGPVRLDKASAEAYVAMQKTTLSYQEVLHIVGDSPIGLKRAVKEGLLDVVGSPSRINDARFTRVSLIRSLRHWIVTGITAEDWLEQRLSSKDGLLKTSSTASLLGISVADVQALIHKGGVIHALTPYGNKGVFEIDPESVQAQREQAKPLTVEEIAMIFGATPKNMRDWLYTERTLVCPIHKHTHRSTFYLSCLCAYLESRCSSAISPTVWIRRALHSDIGPLIREQHAVEDLGIPLHELQEGRQDGKLAAIQLPSGEWKYQLQQLRSPKYAKRKR